MQYLLIILFLIIIGVCFQYLLTKIEEAKYPAPGKMIDIGGYRLHIYDTGSTPGPTIVLDMGLGGNHLYWAHVQSEISKFARVVSYDRAGLGWSERGSLTRTNENFVEELHTLLHKAKIPGPYIFVGHSYAGILARVYNSKYPNDVAGVVLVDSSNENQNQAGLPKPTDFVSRLLNFPSIYPFIRLASKIGLHRIVHLYNSESGNFDSGTQEMIAMITAKNSSTKFIDTILEEWGAFESNLADVRRNKYHLGDKALIVVTASMTPSRESCDKHGHSYPDACNLAYKIWHDLQRDLLTKSTNSKQIHAYNSGHIIQKDEPEIIVEAVRGMVERHCEEVIG